MTQAAFFLGSLFGGPIFGKLADAKGRRMTVIASNLLVGLAGTAAALAIDITTFCAAFFVLGFNTYPQINILYILGKTMDQRSVIIFSINTIGFFQNSTDSAYFFTSC